MKQTTTIRRYRNSIETGNMEPHPAGSYVRYGAHVKAVRKATAEQWRTIESAPTDGTDVLVYWPAYRLSDDDGLTDEVVGGARIVSRFLGGVWQEPDALNAIGAWFDDDCEYGEAPTHWMPLPACPDALEQASLQLEA